MTKAKKRASKARIFALCFRALSRFFSLKKGKTFFFLIKLSCTVGPMKKAVLISGASSGIGLATAQLFSQKNYFVFLMGRNKEKLEEAALTLSSGTSILSCDLTDEAAVAKRLIEVTSHPHYQTEVLINNAGQYINSPFTETGLEQWRLQFEVNLLGSISLTQKMIPYFQKYQKGSIVNVSSTLGLRPVTGTSAYSAIKAAMINWTQSLALELGPNIRANCVCPGIVDTPIHAFHQLPEKEKKETLSQMAGLQPLGRIGTAKEVAESIYFLGSDQSSWTTGAVLSVDGGINLK
jgi:NAD(P)-dependent dehydrogenase (short-subunit alcohol dehydrogenase family)